MKVRQSVALICAQSLYSAVNMVPRAGYEWQTNHLHSKFWRDAWIASHWKNNTFRLKEISLQRRKRIIAFLRERKHSLESKRFVISEIRILDQLQGKKLFPQPSEDCRNGHCRQMSHCLNKRHLKIKSLQLSPLGAALSWISDQQVRKEQQVENLVMIS